LGKQGSPTPCNTQYPSDINKNEIIGYWEDSSSVILVFYSNDHYYLKDSNYLFNTVLHEEYGTYGVGQKLISLTKNKFYTITQDTNHIFDTLFDTSNNNLGIHDDTYGCDSMKLVTYYINNTNPDCEEIDTIKRYYRKDSTEIIPKMWVNLYKP
jgi:hypothetical protein